METSEEQKRALMQQAEASIIKMIEAMEPLERGDLKGLEEQILNSVFALGRGLLEEVMNQQTQAQGTPARRQGECGHRQRLVAVRPRQVLTLLGPISVRRGYYQCLPETRETLEQPPGREPSLPCGHGEAPADRLWGLERGRSSPGVQQVMGYLCASLTLEEAASTFRRLFPLNISARQALHLIQPLGECLGQQEDEQMQALFSQAALARSSASKPITCSGQETRGRLYIEMDGVMARLRRGSVPMEEQEQQRAGDVYREVKVGAVFEAERGPERSALASRVFVDQASQKHYVARRCKAEDFGPLLYSLAQQQGLSHAEQVVILGDGAIWIWNLAAEHFPNAVQIVDVWHAREHVWKVARAVFALDAPAASAWAEPACDLLVEGRIEDLVAAIAALPALPPPPQATHSIPETEMAYFIRNAARMRYPAFRLQGMHIGSGIAEAACKSVVSTRAKRSGMRWTPDGLDAILALRTSVLNEAYDAFWEEQHGLVA